MFANSTHNITFERAVGTEKSSFPTSMYFPKDGEDLFLSYVRGPIDFFTSKPILQFQLKDWESKEILGFSGKARLSFGQFKLELKVWADPKRDDESIIFETPETKEKYSSEFPYSFRRGKEPFRLSIYSNSSYIKDKPRDFQVWKDYPHHASKPGGLKKGFDKLAFKNISIVQELA